MWIEREIIRAWRVLLNRGGWLLVLHGAIALSTAVAAGFAFLAVILGPAAHIDAPILALGLAVLFGVACGAICILLARNRMLARALNSARDRIENLSDQNWELTGNIEAADDLAEARDHAEAANRAKSRFLATVSHEIRTPLNGILGMTDLLLDTGLTPEQKTYVNAVKTSGGTLLSLVDEILDFPR